jgi:hypothetical protein
MTLKQLLHHLNLRSTRLIPSKKFFLTASLVIISGFSLFFSIKTITAQTEPTSNTTLNLIKQKQDAIKKGNNQEAWLDSSLASNIISILGSLTGGIPFQEDGSINLTGYVPGGVIGTTNNMISSLYYQPVSGIEYLAQIKNEFLGKPAYAQNTGFQGLQPILPLWRTIRNFVYALISIFFVTIGTMIMLRVKVNPQTVVNIQNTIPKVITTLILVTFSYAIAGLIIDLSKLVLSLGISVFFNARGITDFNSNLFSTTIDISVNNPFSWIGDLIWAGVEAIAGLFNHHPTNLENLSRMSFGTIYELSNRAIPAVYGVMLGEVAGQIFLGTILGGIGGALLGQLGSRVVGTVGAVAGDVVGGITGWILFPLIMAVLMVIWMIRLYFGLLKSYIVVIFKIIISPIQIGLGAFPTAKQGFSSWIIDLVANISVFPIVSLFIIALNYLTEVVRGGTLWIPSQIDLITITGDIAGYPMGIVAAGIGLAGLGMISKLPQLVPEAIFKLKPDAFGSAIGESYTGLKKTTISGVKAGVDYGDTKRAGRGVSGFLLSATNRILGGKNAGSRDEPSGRPL